MMFREHTILMVENASYAIFGEYKANRYFSFSIDIGPDMKVARSTRPNFARKVFWSFPRTAFSRAALRWGINW